jgi:hypothetical protein
MRLAQEIAATDSLLTDGSCSWFERGSRLVGSHSYPVRVRSFSVPRRDREDGRIVLVLSCRHEQTAEYPHGLSTSNPDVRDTGLSHANLPMGDRLIV